MHNFCFPVGVPETGTRPEQGPGDVQPGDRRQAATARGEAAAAAAAARRAALDDPARVAAEDAVRQHAVGQQQF